MLQRLIWESTLLVDRLEFYAFFFEEFFGGYEDVNMLIAVCGNKLLIYGRLHRNFFSFNSIKLINALHHTTVLFSYPFHRF